MSTRYDLVTAVKVTNSHCRRQESNPNSSVITYSVVSMQNVKYRVKLIQNMVICYKDSAVNRSNF
jgi:hypothetical protein